MALDPEALAEAMFDAYNEQEPNRWQTFDGRRVPDWDELNEQVRGKWIAAAKCALGLIEGTDGTLVGEDGD